MKDRQMACLSDTKPQAKYQWSDHKGLSQTNTVRTVTDHEPKQTSKSQYALKLIFCSMIRSQSTRRQTLL